MTDDPTFAPIEELSALDACDFAGRYEHRRPVVIRGCAVDTGAYRNWDGGYLRERAGTAHIAMRVYGADRADYVASKLEPTTFGAFLDRIAHPDPVVTYLFGDPSTIFACNGERAELRTGFAREPNPGLATLRPDFVVPAFIDPARFVYAALVVGTHANATGLHYDWGGEGKLLVQIRGRKRVVLVPPEQAFRAALHPLSIVEKKPHVAGRDLHALRDVTAFTADLEPGDAVYWPAFWLHDVTNDGALNVAVAVALDEVAVHAPLMRHVIVLALQVFGTALIRKLREGPAPLAIDPSALGKLALAVDGRELCSMVELVRHAEELLLSQELGGKTSLWDWNESLVAKLMSSMMGGR